MKLPSKNSRKIPLEFSRYLLDTICQKRKMLRLELKDTFDFENNESVFNIKSHWIKTNAQDIWPRWTCKEFCNLNNNNNKNYCVTWPKTFSSLQLEGDQKMAWLTWNSTGILNKISKVEWVNGWYLSNLKLLCLLLNQQHHLKIMSSFITLEFFFFWIRIRC